MQTNGQNFWLAKPTIQDLIVYVQEYFNNSYIGILIAVLSLIGLFIYFKNYFVNDISSFCSYQRPPLKDFVNG